MNNKPSICLAFICKNEAHCVLNLLESTYKFIDYWVVCDTGSTDRTKEVIKEFFDSKNIPGELYVDEFQGMGYNKSLMLEKAYGKSDYLLHIDADDKLVGDFEFNYEDEGYDCYMLKTKADYIDWKSFSLFKNNIKWVMVGVAHTIVAVKDNSNFTLGDLSDKNYYVSFEGKGARNFDPQKFQKDAEKLKIQFFETLINDPYGINNRSVFYTAQSYADCENWEEALKWYSLYLKLKDTWDEENFETQIRVAYCMILLNYPMERIHNQYTTAHNIFPDRAEPLFHLGNYYYGLNNYELAYKYFKLASEKNLNEIKRKYHLFINELAYKKMNVINISKCCYNLGFFTEGFNYLNDILNDNSEDLTIELLNDVNHLKTQFLLKLENQKNIDSSVKKITGAELPVKMNNVNYMVV
jgi:glycosyltransferase involved in cell wall biosynthesis